jgi:hypothetical protein
MVPILVQILIDYSSPFKLLLLTGPKEERVVENLGQNVNPILFLTLFAALPASRPLILYRPFAA